MSEKPAQAAVASMPATTLATRFRRARRISITFGRIYLRIKTLQWVDRHLRPPDMAGRWSELNRQAAEDIYSLATELRGLILKGCQFLGARADVLPPEYIDVLGRLQDRVPAHPFPVVRALIEDELGEPIDDVFAEFSEEPIAAASLAQVHEARLHDGRRVAVKVQYPEIARLVKDDLANLSTLFRAVGFLERDFDLMPIVEELKRTMPLELDFMNEAENAREIGALFAPRTDLTVPDVLTEYSSRRVLVMEYVEAAKINDKATLDAWGLDRRRVMQTLIEAYCEQILVRGFFHADPHPGNLFVERVPETVASGGFRIVFIDFGLAKELPTTFRRGIVAFAGAMLKGDADEMAEALVDIGFETREGGVDAMREISALVLDVAIKLRHQTYVDADTAREAADALPRLIRRNPIVRIPSHVVLLGRVVGLLSGLGRTLEAQIDMLHTVLPYAMGMRQAPAPPPPDDPPAT